MCDEWHSLKAFKKWHDNNFIEGFHLDKDILVEGNKVYSPETCVYVTPLLNSIFVDNGVSRSGYPTGVRYKERNKKI